MRLRSSVADHQAGRSLVRRAPSLHRAWRRPEPRHRRYQPASSPCRRRAPRGLVRQVECPDAPSSMPSGRHEWRVLPSPHCLRRRRPAAPARRRLWHRCLRLPHHRIVEGHSIPASRRMRCPAARRPSSCERFRRLPCQRWDAATGDDAVITVSPTPCRFPLRDRC